MKDLNYEMVGFFEQNEKVPAGELIFQFPILATDMSTDPLRPRWGFIFIIRESCNPTRRVEVIKEGTSECVTAAGFDFNEIREEMRQLFNKTFGTNI